MFSRSSSQAITWPARWLAVSCLIVAWCGLWRGVSSRPAAPRSIRGQVVSKSQPIASARVRLQGQPDFVLSDRRGRFRLTELPPAERKLAAWKDGYFIGGASVDSRPRVIELTALPEQDFADYAWVDPQPDAQSPGNCGNCHRAIYEEWRGSGHGRASDNRRFQNLLDGSDWHGRPGQGWSLLDEYPAGAGVCAACHAPTADFGDLPATDGQGVHCDFCHKIAATRVEQVGLTHGRYAYDLLRPSEGQIFFGPLDDVDRGEDVYSPLQSESRYCAGCHEGVVFGVHVYSTWSEWLASPARRQGRQCQSCHMRPGGDMTNIAPGHGGIERDPATLASHTMLPGGRAAMLQSALRVKVRIDQAERRRAAVVRVTAENVGHRLPTGFIDRHLVLSVEPRSAEGAAVDVIGGPVLPPAAGAAWAGRPGRLFAKLLTDEDNRPAPFWRSGLRLEDTRLAPDSPQVIRFELPDDAASVRVRLLYRRFWPETTQSKSWPSDEIVVFDENFDGGPR